MLDKTTFNWPPQPSTVIGLGVMAGSLCYLVTGDPVWAGLAAAAIKILVPDNSLAKTQALDLLRTLARPAGRRLRAVAQPAQGAARDRGFDPRSVSREPPQK